MTFFIKLSGFNTMEQAKGFLNWFEGQGEQDDTIGCWLGDEEISIVCDVRTGMIQHADGVEYRIRMIGGRPTNDNTQG